VLKATFWSPTFDGSSVIYMFITTLPGVWREAPKPEQRQDRRRRRRRR
jgi:hypothetical protein